MMFGVTTSTGASAADATTSSSGTSSAKEQEDRFLKLLVAQLANQDPMNPMDNAQMTTQMAQISTVSAVQQVDATLKSMADQMSALQVMQGGALVGKNVMIEGNQLAVSDGKATGAVDLTLAADTVKVLVVSGGGQLVETLNLGAQSAGRHDFTWDATKYPGVVNPSFEVVATVGGKAVENKRLVQDKVVSVSSGTNGLQLQLNKLGNVAYSSVNSIF